MLRIRLNRILLNIGFVGFADILARVFGFFAVMLLARYLGPEDYGKYCLVLSFAFIFSHMANFGIDTLTIKDVSKDRSLSRQYSALHFLLRPPIALICIIILNLSAAGLGYPRDVLVLMVVFSIHILFASPINAICSLFIANERMEYYSIVSIINSLLMCLFIVVLIFLNGNLLEIIVSRVLAFLITFPVALLILIKIFLKPRFSGIRVNHIKYMIFGALPFLAIGLTTALYTQIDIIMLSKLKGEVYVGWYAAAAKDIFFAMFIIPKTITAALFPNFSKTFKQSSELFARNVKFTLKAIIVLGAPISAGIFLLAPRIIDLAFGSNFGNSIIILQIMSVGLMIGFLNNVLGYALTAAEKVKTLMCINLSFLVLNIALNAFFIPLFAHIGAAISSVICSFFSLSCLIFFLRRNIEGIRMLQYFLKPSLASMGMVITLYFIGDINLFLLIFVGALIYFAILILHQPFDKEEKVLLTMALTKH